MAEGREVFTILEDNATADGVKLPARSEGVAVAGNHIPSLVAKDGAGAYQLVPIRAEGATVAGNELPVLAVKNVSGQWVHIPLDSFSRIPVTTFVGSPGTRLKARAAVNGVLNTATDVCTITLAVATVYEMPDFISSTTFHTLWELVWLDDATDTILSSWITGPGGYHFGKRMEDITFTSGATGTQTLRLRGTQTQGQASSMHGTLTVQTV